MEKIKNFISNSKTNFDGFRSNFYVREPVYDSNVRAKRTYEGFYIGAIAISPLVVALSIEAYKSFFG